MKTGFPLGIRGRVGRLRAARVAQGHKPMHRGGQSQWQLRGDHLRLCQTAFSSSLVGLFHVNLGKT